MSMAAEFLQNVQGAILHAKATRDDGPIFIVKGEIRDFVIGIYTEETPLDNAWMGRDLAEQAIDIVGPAIGELLTSGGGEFVIKAKSRDESLDIQYSFSKARAKGSRQIGNTDVFVTKTRSPAAPDA